MKSTQKKNWKKVHNFKSTRQLFDYINKCLAQRRAGEAGQLFEDYLNQYYTHSKEYAKVYDANNHIAIPQDIIDDHEFGGLLVGANSIGIDRICVRHDGGVEVHQDKTGLRKYAKDKKASIKLAQGMMSYRNNPLVNISEFVLNTTLSGASKHYSIWTTQPPLIRSYQHFVPNILDQAAQERDKLLWQNIKNSGKRGTKTVNINKFTPKTKHQTNYIKAFDKQFNLDLLVNGEDWTAGHAIVVGSFGKGVVDPVMMARAQKKYWPYFMDTPQPISVTFFHSRMVLEHNGWEAVMRRRGEGIYDRVIVVSGTDVIDGESDSLENPSAFTKVMNVEAAVDAILDAMEKDQSVHILTLYHHARTIEQIEAHMYDHYKNFWWWHVHRDECDWAASNTESSYAPAFTLRARITTGSSGTELDGCPIEDHGTNNEYIHGPCVYRFNWAQAQDAKMVKPLTLITPTVRLSELIDVFPGIVNEKGEFAYRNRVKFGEKISNLYIMAEHLVNMYGFALALRDYPQLKRLVGFSHRIQTNALIEANIFEVMRVALEGKRDAYSSRVRRLHTEVLNNRFNSEEMNMNHIRQIKRAKNKELYLIMTCRKMSRGYNDAPPALYDGPWKKHHAAIHFDVKSIRDMIQEIWRVIRQCAESKDPNAYYVLPVIYNDLDEGEEHWTQETIDRINAIMQYNDRVKDDILKIIKHNSAKGNRYNTNTTVPQLEEMDPELLQGMINQIAYTTKGKAFKEVFDQHIEAHDRITKEMLKLNEMRITAPHAKKDIYKSILPDYPVLFQNYKYEVLRSQWFPAKQPWMPENVKSHMQTNLQKIEDYKANVIAKNQKKHIAARKRLTAEMLKIKDCPVANGNVSEAYKTFENDKRNSFLKESHSAKDFRGTIRDKWSQGDVAYLTDDTKKAFEKEHEKVKKHFDKERKKHEDRVNKLGIARFIDIRMSAILTANNTTSHVRIIKDEIGLSEDQVNRHIVGPAKKDKKQMARIKKHIETVNMPKVGALIMKLMPKHHDTGDLCDEVLESLQSVGLMAHDNSSGYTIRTKFIENTPERKLAFKKIGEKNFLAAKKEMNARNTIERGKVQSTKRWYNNGTKNFHCLPAEAKKSWKPGKLTYK